MRSILALLIVAIVAVLPVSAGVFDRKPKMNPADRLGQLLVALKMDPDAGKRADAANELRNYDGATYPEVVPVLIEALQKDASASVRREAAQSLGRVKPFTVEAAEALLQAQESDSSAMVRVQARMARVGYRVTQPRTPEPAPTTNSTPTIKMPSFGREKAPTVQVLPPPSKLLTPVSRPLPKPEGETKPMPNPAPPSKPVEEPRAEPILVEPRRLSPSFSAARPIQPAAATEPAEKPAVSGPILAVPKP